jgi:hypothetical protein
VRNKLGTSKSDARQKAVVLLYGDGKLAAAGKEKEARPSDRELGVSGQEAFLCARSIGASNELNDLVPSRAASQQRPEQTSLDYRICPCRKQNSGSG